MAGSALIESRLESRLTSLKAVRLVPLTIGSPGLEVAYEAVSAPPGTSTWIHFADATWRVRGVHRARR